MKNGEPVLGEMSGPTWTGKSAAINHLPRSVLESILAKSQLRVGINRSVFLGVIIISKDDEIEMNHLTVEYFSGAVSGPPAQLAERLSNGETRHRCKATRLR